MNVHSPDNQTPDIQTPDIQTPDIQTPDIQTAARYLAPDFVTRRIANPIMSTLVKAGIGVRGGRILQVRGRTTGEWRTVPVNPLTIDGSTYLVAPRGTTQWVRNLRAAGEGRLRKGRRSTPFVASEVVDADKPPIIRAYLEVWAMETAKFFDGLDASSTEAEILAVAPGFPVFRVTTG